MIGRYGLDIARAAERDYTFEHKFGSNPNLTAGNQTIWTQGGMYPWAALDGDAQTLYIVSTSASDLDTIEIFGLDNNWELQTDTVTMTGQTAVPTNVPFKRIYRMIYDHTAQNVGTITARTVSGAGTVVAHIGVGVAQTLASIYTIPSGYNGYLCKYTAGVGKGGDSNFRIYVRYNHYGVSTFNVKSDVNLYQTTISQDYTVPLKLIQKTDIDFRALTTGNNFSATASFDIILDKI